MKTSVRIAFCLALCCIFLLAISALVEAGKPPPPPPPSSITRAVSMSVRDDYNKGETFAGNIDMDLANINDLGVDEFIFSVGWDDYEPTDDAFDWNWLDSFIAECASYGVKSRPYICYCPEWAAPAYNLPPYDNAEFYEFCYEFAMQYKNNANVLSIEMWNEEDGSGFWSGTIAEFTAMIEQGVAGLRAAGWTKPIIIGGLTHWADNSFTWHEAFYAGTWETNFDIDAFHVYAEFTPNDSVEQYFVGFGDYISVVNNDGEGEPIWVTEDSYSTLDRTYEMQASYFVRSIINCFGANDTAGEIEHYDIYQIRDEDPNDPLIGSEDMRYLGITDYLGNKKDGFYACSVMVDLFDDKTITSPKNDQVTTTVTSGRKRNLYNYRIDRSDGSIIVAVYDRGISSSITVKCTLANTSKTTCTKFNILDGTSTDWTSNFSGGNTIENIVLATKEKVGLFLVQ